MGGKSSVLSCRKELINKPQKASPENPPEPFTRVPSHAAGTVNPLRTGVGGSVVLQGKVKDRLKS